MASNHLENMEGFKLDVSAAINEHFHHQLEVVRVTDVETHCSEVVTVKK